jgi:mycoredoxin
MAREDPFTGLKLNGGITMIKMYTTTWCGDCKVTKRVLEQRGIAFEEINIEENDQAAEYVMSVNGGRRSVPTLEARFVQRSSQLNRITKINLE